MITKRNIICNAGMGEGRRGTVRVRFLSKCYWGIATEISCRKKKVKHSTCNCIKLMELLYWLEFMNLGTVVAKRMPSFECYTMTVTS